jgi:predicted DNA-binding transcriptional regulator AlpA
MAATNLKTVVSISKWVNEVYPSWGEILSAHDVARLTRRHRWVLSAMAALRRFPRKRRFHGRAVGWHRGDVIRWLANHLSSHTAPRRPSTLPLPLSLPKGCSNRRNSDPQRGSGRTVRRRRTQSIKRMVPTTIMREERADPNCREGPMIRQWGAVNTKNVTLPNTAKNQTVPSGSSDVRLHR